MTLTLTDIKHLVKMNEFILMESSDVEKRHHLEALRLNYSPRIML